MQPISLKDGDQVIVGPPLAVVANVAVLHQILPMVVEDWHRAVAPYETRIAGGLENPEFVMGQGFLDLQPAFLKSLFSYVFFFVATEQAYQTVWKSLARLNKVAKVERAGPPRRSTLIDKAHAIRNWSIAHFPSTNASPLNSEAAMSWAPMALTKPHGGEWNLKELTFGPFRLVPKSPSGGVVQSRDLEIQGLNTLHQACMSYLEAYDAKCADFLEALHKKGA